jgi:transcriptional regulator with XRE-family HTH domain
MNDRIKELRKELGLNQTEFGEKLGVKQTTIAGYENGSRQPLDTVISSICREFNVNEEWIRYGTGSKYKKRNRNQEILEFMNQVMSETDDSIKVRIASAMTKLDENDWQTIEKIVDILAQKKEG